MTRSSNTDRRRIAEVELHGYLDGELDTERHAEVEHYLAKHPDIAARVAEYGDLTLDLHRLFDADVTPVSPEIEVLTEELASALGRRRLVRRLFGAAAAVAVITAGVGLATGFSDRFRQAEDRFIAFTREATDAHLLFAGDMPVTAGTHPGKDTTVVSWLSQRLTGVPARAPDLRARGYELTVERILPSADGPAAQLMYESRTKAHPITLFIGRSRDSKQSAFTFVRNADLSVFYWQEGAFAYSLAGKLGRMELLALAEEVDAQLMAVPPIPKTMAQRRTGESTRAVDKTVAATGSVNAVSVTVPETGAAAADGLAPAHGKREASDKRGVTGQTPDDAPKVKPVVPATKERKPTKAPVLPVDRETPKKT